MFGEKNGHDAHCKVCGSLLYSVVRDGAYVHVAMGTLVDDPTIRPTEHIFAGSKAPWFTITDDLPQYDGHVVAAGPSRWLAALRRLLCQRTAEQSLDRGVDADRAETIAATAAVIGISTPCSCASPTATAGCTLSTRG